MFDAPKAVIWDVDGTLIDSGAMHFLAWQSTLANEQVAYDQTHHETTFGQRNDAILRRLISPTISTADIKRIGDAKEELYRSFLAVQGPTVLPGVEAWLQHLQATGWRMAIASSASHANLDAILQATGLRDYFGAIVSGDDVAEGKPNPAIFLHAAAALNVDPARCIVVEDAAAGVEAGQRAGMRVIGVGPGHAALPAHRTTAQLDQLPPDTFEQLLATPVRPA